MATNNETKKAFEYYKVSCGVDSIFGNWVVCQEADVINIEHKYPIFTTQVISESIDSRLEQMRDRIWFTSLEEEDFKLAYLRAEDIIEK